MDEEEAEEEEGSVSVSNLLKNFECGICLETLDIPRRLECDHYFCKHCLDNLLKFNKRGICTIKCPNQCAKITTLLGGQTTLDLGTDYVMRGILDMVVQEDQTSTVAKKRECKKLDCSQESTKYCHMCNSTYCSSCECPCSSDYFSIMSDRNGKLVVLCDLHTSIAKWVCVHGDNGKGIFVCVYCVNRNHRNHKVQTITKYARGCRSKLSNEIAKVIQLQNEVIALQEGTQREMDAARQALIMVLNYRKLVCFSQYLHRLNGEEEKLLTSFDEILDRHKEQYDFGYVDAMRIYKDLVSKSNLMFVMNLARYIQPEKPNIVSNIVTLSAHDFMSLSPLGEIVDISPDDDHNDGVDNICSLGNAKTSMEFQIDEVDVSAMTSVSDMLAECWKKMFPDVVQQRIEDQVENLLCQRLSEKEEHWNTQLKDMEEALERAKSNEAQSLKLLQDQCATAKAYETQLSLQLKEIETKLKSAQIENADSQKRFEEVQSKLKLAEAKIFQLWSNMTLQKEELELDTHGCSWSKIHDGYYTRLLNRERSLSEAEAEDTWSSNRLKTMTERAETAEARAAGYYKRLMERETSLKKTEHYGAHLISRVKDLERDLISERSYKLQLNAHYSSLQQDFNLKIKNLQQAKRKNSMMETALLMVFLQYLYWSYRWVSNFFV